MKRQFQFAAIAAALGVVSTSPALSGQIFFDDFSGSTLTPGGSFTTVGSGGSGTTFTSGTNSYTVYGGDAHGLNSGHLGNIDLVNPGYFENLCEAGRSCVDLDGTGGGGRREDYFYTNSTIDLEAGKQYRLTVRADTQNRNQTSSFYYGLLGANPNFVLSPTSYVLESGAAHADFFNYTFDFTLASLGLSSPTSVRLFFENGSSGYSDNIGAVISSIEVSTVPLPAAAWLLLSGLGAVGMFARRRRIAAA